MCVENVSFVTLGANEILRLQSWKTWNPSDNCKNHTLLWIVRMLRSIERDPSCVFPFLRESVVSTK